MSDPGTLYFYCGKMGAGKSTHAGRLARERNAVQLSEDDWLSTLFPDRIGSLADYRHYSARLRPLLQSHVPRILATGTDVVMDFPGNTRANREWLLRLADAAKAPHCLIYLDIDDDQCLRQIAQRRLEQPERAAFDNETVFRQLLAYFEEPDAVEGLVILRIATDIPG
jgi:predicted kinase